jgi:iron complex outermembrane receptor protein
LLPSRAPEWTAKLQASYDWEIGDLGTLTPLAIWSYEGSHYTNTTNAPQGFQPRYSTWDADLTFEEAKGRWRLSAYAKNITNKTHLLNANPIAGLFTVNYYAAPRTYGVELGVNF